MPGQLGGKKFNKVTRDALAHRRCCPCEYFQRSVLMSCKWSSSSPLMSTHSIPSNLLWGLGPPSSGSTNDVSEMSSGSCLSEPKMGGGTLLPRELVNLLLPKQLHTLELGAFVPEQHQVQKSKTNSHKKIKLKRNILDGISGGGNERR